MFWWLVLILLLVVLVVVILWRQCSGEHWGGAKWPYPAWRVFQDDPTVYAPFHHRGLTDLPDGGHPNDPILTWWRQQPEAWRVKTIGCSRYSCPSRGVICAAQEKMGRNERTTLEGADHPATYQAHPTACEKTDRTYYDDENEFCRYAPTHPTCRNGGRSTEGVLLEHPVGLIDTGF